MNEIKKVYINWEPQERQLVCLKACGLSQLFKKNLKLRPSGSKGEKFRPAIATHIGYGGAAGGGKTDSMVAVALVAAIVYPGINIGCFRRKFPQLKGLGGFIERSKAIIPPEAAIYHKTDHLWNFFNTSKIAFCHCQNPDDVQNYQSQQFDIIMLDETTQFLESMIKFLLTRNRATVDYPTFKPFALFATNPGGVGHSYFKREFVDIGKHEQLHEYINETGETETHFFIPAKLKDNKILTDRDPEYEIKLSPSLKIREMLLEGNWDYVPGSEFDEFRRNKHGLNRSLKPHSGLPRFVGTDWGYTGRDQDKGAFATLFMVVIKMYVQGKQGDKNYFNRVVVYKEYYGKKKSPERWAEIIFNDKDCDKVYKARCDPSMFNPQSDGSTSIAERMMDKWRGLNKKKFFINYKRGTRNRISRCANLHDWLADAPDGMPYLLFTDDCSETMRTLPLLMTDENNPRDVNTELEDHLYDCLTYMLTAIKFIGQVGSFGATDKWKRWRRFRPAPRMKLTKAGKQKGLDLDAFANVKMGGRDWKSI